MDAAGTKHGESGVPSIDNEAILGESGVPSRQGQLQFDEIFEETIDTETIERQEQDKRQVLCDWCFINGVLNVISFYFCIVCGRYYCEKCFTGHDRTHKFIRSESKDGEREREIDEFVSYMMNESDDERKKKSWEDDVRVCDIVDIKHGLDKVEKYLITGLTGYENKWWVVCNNVNLCIKVFSLSSNILQRYIRLGSKPYDVTEIIVENKTTEQDSASGSEAAISETDNKTGRKKLLAVTLQAKCLILILDLGKNPAVIHSKIKTEKECRSIEFYDGNIHTVCGEPSLFAPTCTVYIMTVDGVTLKTVQTDVPYSWLSYLTVLNGNIYMTDYVNQRVVCYNDKGRVLHQIKIGSRPVGICVDRSEDKVYVSAIWYDKVYELKSDLSRYKSVLGQTTRYMNYPDAMCFYSDKLYVGHWPESRSHVTVVRLL